MARGLLLAAAILGGCGGDGHDAAVTFHADVRPIVERDCLSCHQPGGVAPLDFTYEADDWKDGAPAWAPLAVHAVATGSMPPWPPSDDCRPLLDARRLSDEDRAVFAAWAEGGFAEGDSADFVPPELPDRPDVDDLGPPDLDLADPEGWVPRTSPSDEYRCFVLRRFDQETWFRALAFDPDDDTVVHHAIVYQYDAGQTGAIADVLRRDAEDPGPGYDCWGNPDAETMLAWAPGQTPQVLPGNVGLRAGPGALWILQIHYNTLGRNPADLRPDRSRVRAWTHDVPPHYGRVTLPLAKGDIFLPAGRTDIVQTERYDLGWLEDFARLVDAPVVGVMAHMHQLGTAFEARLVDDAGNEECLLHIPVWDFHWQMAYHFPEAHWVRPRPNQDLVFSCHYDNSAENQPVVDGQRLPPRDVRWGEGTRDEMCLLYVQVQLPAFLLAQR